MLLRYLFWHYGRGLRSVFRIAGNFFAFSLHLFSVRELSDSLFAPWKQITFSHRGGFLTAEALEALWGNVISRVLGAMARSVLIAIGVFFAAIVVALDIVIIVLWLLAPLIPLGFVLLGVSRLR
jgi:hypothetical protein